MQINEFPMAASDSSAMGKPPRRGGVRVVTPYVHPNITSVGPVADARPLTPREQEVLVLLSKGLRYKEIMDSLGISQGTLHFFIRNLYAKLGVHSRTEAAMKLVNNEAGPIAQARQA